MDNPRIDRRTMDAQLCLVEALSSTGLDSYFDLERLAHVEFTLQQAIQPKSADKISYVPSDLMLDALFLAGDSLKYADLAREITTKVLDAASRGPRKTRESGIPQRAERILRELPPSNAGDMIRHGSFQRITSNTP
jgi:hypothetical protein